MHRTLKVKRQPRTIFNSKGVHYDSFPIGVFYIRTFIPISYRQAIFLPIRTHQCKNERHHNSSNTRESGASTKSHIPTKTKQLLSIMLPVRKDRSFLLTGTEVAVNGSVHITFQKSSESGPKILIFEQSSKKRLSLVASLIQRWELGNKLILIVIFTFKSSYHVSVSPN